jgi:hypothetical protein
MNQADPIAAATIIAIDNLIAMLTDARKYLSDGNTTAAIGALSPFDFHADDPARGVPPHDDEPEEAIVIHGRKVC